MVLNTPLCYYGCLKSQCLWMFIACSLMKLFHLLLWRNAYLLSKNIELFGNRFYHQIKGPLMWAPVVPNKADLFIVTFEIKNNSWFYKKQLKSYISDYVSFILQTCAKHLSLSATREATREAKFLTRAIKFCFTSTMEPAL